MKTKLLKKLHQKIRWEYNRERNVWIVFDRDRIAPYALDKHKLDSVICYYYIATKGSPAEYLASRYEKLDYLIKEHHTRLYKKLNQRFVKHNF